MLFLFHTAHAAGYDLDDLALAAQRGLPVDTMRGMVAGAPVELEPGQAVLLLRAGVPAEVLQDATGGAHPTEAEHDAAMEAGPKWEVDGAPGDWSARARPLFPDVMAIEEEPELPGAWSHTRLVRRGRVEIAAGAGLFAAGMVVFVAEGREPRPFGMAAGLAMAAVGSVTLTFGMRDHAWGMDVPGLYSAR